MWVLVRAGLLYLRHLVTSSGSVPAWDCIFRSQASSPDQNNPRRSFYTSENATRHEINTIIWLRYVLCIYILQIHVHVHVLFCFIRNDDLLVGLRVLNTACHEKLCRTVKCCHKMEKIKIKRTASSLVTVTGPSGPLLWRAGTLIPVTEVSQWNLTCWHEMFRAASSSSCSASPHKEQPSPSNAMLLRRTKLTRFTRRCSTEDDLKLVLKRCHFCVVALNIKNRNLTVKASISWTQLLTFTGALALENMVSYQFIILCNSQWLGVRISNEFRKSGVCSSLFTCSGIQCRGFLPPLAHQLLKKLV